MIKKVILYTDPKDPYCVEVEKFLQGCEIILKIHDIRKNPLNVRQLSRLLKHFNLEHFLNPNGKSGKMKKLDTSPANRQKILELLAEDIGLLRKPIVVSGRLMTMGYDRRKIMDMLQIKDNGNGQECQADSAA